MDVGCVGGDLDPFVIFFLSIIYRKILTVSRSVLIIHCCCTVNVAVFIIFIVGWFIVGGIVRTPAG